MVARDGRSSRECGLRGSGLDDVVGTASVDMKRDVALMIIERGRVDDTLQHGPLSVRHLSVKHAQVASLGMTTIPEGRGGTPGIPTRRWGMRASPPTVSGSTPCARPSLTIQARKRCRIRPPWLWVTTAISDAFASTVVYSVARVLSSPRRSYRPPC